MADEALTAGAVARRLGVAVTTLRTWHQRYGLGPSQHVPGQHRRYTPDDMERLEVMRRLTAQGVSPAEAAAWARRVPLPAKPLGASGPAPAPSSVSSGSAGPSPAPSSASPGPSDASPGSAGPSPGPSDASPDPPEPGPRLPAELLAVPLRPPSRDGGGHAIPTGRSGPAARGMARAAMRLDAPALREILAREITDRGVIGTWEQVVMPVLIGVGERYEATKRLIEVEHLTSRCVSEVFASVPRPGTNQVPRVLLSCADEEQHTLPMEALAAALAEAGVASRLLGARVPAPSLADAVTRTGPAAVVVWSQLPGTARPDQLTQLLVGGTRPLVVAAAGPGWSSRDLPPEIPILGSLTEAVRVVAAAVGVQRQAG